MVLEKILQSPLESNQSILKEINPEYSLEGLMLKLKFQYFRHLMGRTDSMGKTLMLRKTEGWKRRGQQRMRCWMASLTQWIWVWAPPGVGDGQGSLACCSPWGCKESDMTEWLNWTDWTQDNLKHNVLNRNGGGKGERWRVISNTTLSSTHTTSLT